MPYKILEKIKSIFLPCISLLSSTIFFISIGGVYGLNSTSDSIFLILTIVTTVGTILQISWYGFLPKLTLINSKNNLCYIISNSIYYCAIINITPIIIALIYNNIYFLLGGFVYSLFFQIHQLARNIFVYLGKVRFFYLFDAIGYAINSFTLISLSFYQQSPSGSLVFISLSLGWFIVNIVELFFLREYIKPYLSSRPLYKFIAPTIKPRIANCAFILKDLLMAITLNSLAPNGGLTTYTYLNKIAISIFQIFSIYKVNVWISQFSTHDKKKISLQQIKEISRSSLKDYLIFLFIAIISFYILVTTLGVNYNYSWALYSITISGLLYLIQSIEQPFARYVYINKLFNDVTKADSYNFIIYVLFFTLGYILSNIYVILLGLIFSQLISYYVYYNSSKKYITKQLTLKNTK